jgi:transposase-like protein
MTKTDTSMSFHSSPEIIRLAVMMYVRFPLSFRNVEDLLHERGWSRGWNAGVLRHKTTGSQSGIEIPQEINEAARPPTYIGNGQVAILRCGDGGNRNADKQKTGRWLNNRAENFHLPFRRPERAMQRFRSMRSLQEFVAVHASIDNHFNQERALYSRDNLKLNRAAALAEWRQLCSA